MTLPITHSKLDAIELVILARASDRIKPTTSELVRAAASFRTPGTSVLQARRTARDILPRLRDRGWLAEHRPRWQLTHHGTEILRRAFAIASVPAWPKLRDQYMPALGLGLAPEGRQAKIALATRDSLVASIVGASSDASPRTVAQLCDALLAGSLGLATRSFTLFELRAHVLARHLGLEVKRLPRTSHAFRAFAAQAAAGELQIRRSAGQAQLLTALSLRWLHHKPPAAPTLLHAVRDSLAKVGAAGRFGHEKVFISALWRELVRQRELKSLSLEDFKRWLIDANREQTIDLVRADLVSAMDPRLVTDSEIEDLGATFHFVVDRQAQRQTGEA